jgi:predicted metalloprotease with PDZ domain
MSRSLRAACWLGGVAAAIVLTGTTAWAAPAAEPIPAPVDHPFAGEMRLEVDATDLDRRIVHVHETLTGLSASTVLLYPKWLPGTHAPEGPIDRFAGLQVSVAGHPIPWSRDTVNVYAFRLQVPRGASTVELRFDYLSPTSDKVGPVEITRDLLMLEWNEVVLYPAGYYARQIPVKASLSIPPGWKLACALDRVRTEGVTTEFARVPLETLIDSPVFAGRYSTRIDLDAATGVHLNVFADRPDLLETTPEIVAAHKALVTQAYKLYGSHHYAHYDFLLALTDQLPSIGLEHHQSSEDTTDPEYFIEWEGTPAGRDLLAHEYTHSWNGKFRRPADLWTPSYEVPMRDSLLWVYEGQTQYWGLVLTARAGLWSRTQALDAWAEVAAYYTALPGRQWRPLQDTTNDEIINPRRPLSWTSWQRFEDYYDEGALLWLDVDTLIRERSGGKRSLDDFARRFLGINDGSFTPVTYTFEDLVKVLNEVEPYDWARFLRERLDEIAHGAPLDGLKRGGYRLVYTDKESEYLRAEEAQRKLVMLESSIGLNVDDKDGTIAEVLWESPAFKAGLTEGMEILAINGVAYSGELLKRTIRSGKGLSAPIVLILKNADRYIIASLDYSGGLRYPHLERDAALPPRLEDILAPR